jgi:hypothetical protein
MSMSPIGPTGGTSGLKKTGYRSVQNFSPEQTQLFRELFGQLGPESFMGRLSRGDQGTFEEMERPAFRQFSGLQGNLASRFSGMGTGGARRSSGFQNTMNSATSQFAQDLQGNRMNLQRQAWKDLQEMSQSLLQQRPFSYLQKQKPFWQEMLAGLSSGIGQGIGSLPALAF